MQKYTYRLDGEGADASAFGERNMFPEEVLTEVTEAGVVMSSFVPRGTCIHFWISGIDGSTEL